MTPPSGIGRQLTADDWIQAGFALLTEGGPDALKIGALCTRLNVTKGSFYWHFTDMAEYRAALAAAWSKLHDARQRRIDDTEEADPRTRLTMLMNTLARPDHLALERAMRVWATTDETVLSSVHRSDLRVLCAVRQAFADCGFGAEEADLRSSVLFATGLGLLHGAATTDEPPTPLGEQVVEFVLRQ